MLLSAASAGGGLSQAAIAGLHAAARSEVQLAHSPQSDPLALVQTVLRDLRQESLVSGKLDTTAFGDIENHGGAPAVSIHVRVLSSNLLSKLQILHFRLLDANRAQRVIEGYLPLASLAAAASLRGVSAVDAIQKPAVHSVGAAPNQADVVENVARARNAFGVTGAGVKVGVISDSVNMLGGLAASIASADLPKNVVILKDGMQGDSDEGRAILEELHDLAPGAQLYFHTGDGSQDEMVAAISALRNAGCKVILDDLGYGDEPMFQDGVIGRAINSFVAGGGAYFSAIGNDANSGYLHANTRYTTAHGSTFVNWAGNGLASGETLSFTVDGPVDMTLQWDNPYNGDSGAATSDLNVFIYQNGKLVTSAADANISSGIPEEVLATLAPGTYQMKIQLAALAPGALPPDMIKFVASEQGMGGVSWVQYPGIRGSAYGHGSGQNTISVGAVDFADAPPYSASVPIPSEAFSSTGPIVYAFDANGTKLAQPLTLNKPDVSGVDGVNTTFFGELTPTDPTMYPQFYGTSAATPNVAAIAALIDQLKPGATQAQILAALRASATPLNGAAPNAWDPQGGYGLVNADKALAFIGSAQSSTTAKFSAVASPRTAPLAAETISFSAPVNNLALSSFVLQRNGGADLLDGAVTLSSQTATTFTLGDLTALTSAAGVYTLTLKPTGITSGGQPLASGASITWTKTAGAVVVARHLFYNDSRFDGSSASINAADDQAFATDKAALLPGQTATFANYSSYSRGINGVMIDVANLTSARLSASDFVFAAGNNNATSTWRPAPRPLSISVRRGAGIDGSARVEIVWPNHSADPASAVANDWLSVRMKADANTGLSASDVFYFGNAIGQTGENALSAAVTSADVRAIKAHESFKSAPITSNWDITRDGIVNYADANAAAADQTSGANALQLIKPT